MNNLKEAEFDTRFTPVPNNEGDVVRPDHHGYSRDSKHLWTIVEAESALYAITGWHLVNRVGYLITEQPWEEETEAVWYEPGDDDGDDPDNERQEEEPHHA
ncbi:hypothetical protein ANMWB30_24380 [Arthrobacter sp. MWB30]|nr:hypothetical protein ANMWB30_24380 [Arthrobacter sp. MWB30]